MNDHKLRTMTARDTTSTDRKSWRFPVPLGYELLFAAIPAAVETTRRRASDEDHAGMMPPQTAPPLAQARHVTLPTTETATASASSAMPRSRAAPSAMMPRDARSIFEVRAKWATLSGVVLSAWSMAS